MSEYARSLRVSTVSLLTGTSLAAVKLLAGLLGNSYALIADAVESMADIFASLVVMSGLRIASLPPDENHPYGHGKAEPLAAMFVAMMLAGAGLSIGVAAVREILTPHHAPAAFTLWVLVGVIAVKEGLFRTMRRVGMETDSSAVMADAWHHRSDALTSLAAGIGITIALIGGEGYESADDWAALVAAGVILYNAYHLSARPVHELMDAEPGQLIEQVREIAAKVPGVAGVEKVFARKSGIRYWVDMHVEVDPNMPVHRAHGIAHEVQECIRAAMPQVQNVLIHIEPFPGKSEVAS